jgi:CYTH domain-containing protein
VVGKPARPTPAYLLRVIGTGTDGLKSAEAGPVRDEYEIDIPDAFGSHLIGSSYAPRVVTTRYFVEHVGARWEVDVFGEDNSGLSTFGFPVAGEGHARRRRRGRPSGLV